MWKKIEIFAIITMKDLWGFAPGTKTFWNISFNLVITGAVVSFLEQTTPQKKSGKIFAM